MVTVFLKSVISSLTCLLGLHHTLPQCLRAILQTELAFSSKFPKPNLVTPHLHKCQWATTLPTIVTVLTCNSESLYVPVTPYSITSVPCHSPNHRLDNSNINPSYSLLHPLSCQGTLLMLISDANWKGLSLQWTFGKATRHSCLSLQG